MAKITLEALGITKEALLERVVDALADDISVRMDASEITDRAAAKRVEALRAVVDEKLNSILTESQVAAVAHHLETLTLTPTNNYGEPKGKAMTLREYVAHRATTFLTELVDFNGLSKEEYNKRDSYGWRENCTRVQYLVQYHLSHLLTSEAKKALNDLGAEFGKVLSDKVRHATTEYLKYLADKKTTIDVTA